MRMYPNLTVMLMEAADYDTSVGRNLTPMAAPMAQQPVTINAQALYQIPVYTIILLLSVLGNGLVILTLVQNRRMRTITNVFLLNLAVSDLLLGVLCMPITLLGALLRDFVFGRIMCKLMPYLQACSVSVSAWTLVAISCERYYAICHPLRSRRWQTLSHSYRLIVLIWLLSLLLMSPIAALSRLIPTSHGHHKCREYWPEDRRHVERLFNVYLDAVLLVLPLLVLATTYSLITATVWRGIRAERDAQQRRAMKSNLNPVTSASALVSCMVVVYINGHGSATTRLPANDDSAALGTHSEATHSSLASTSLRKSTTAKDLRSRRRVIRMLFVVVLEFFVCWTPLYVINTLVLFDPQLVYETFGYATISCCQLLAYSSSCCNPITYCFMNRGFRKAFASLFSCWHPAGERKRRGHRAANGDELQMLNGRVGGK